MKTIVIPGQFNGPPGAGNGGYVCGKLASALSSPGSDQWTEVTVRASVPLDTELRVQEKSSEAELYDGDTLVASARKVEIDLDIPEPPATELVREAAKHYRWRDDHPIPECFVCGPLRADDDGLRLFAGPIRDSEHVMVGTPWRPHPSLAGPDGLIPPEIIWAALDCPGAYAIDELETTSLKLLGRLTARTLKAVRPDTNCTVLGWYINSEGRKHLAGTAVFDESGDLAGVGKATWIELKSEPSHVS